MNTKICTSIEQSKKFVELGINIDTADMYWTNESFKGEMYNEPFKLVYGSYLRAKDSLDAYSKIVNSMIAWEYIPAWSLSAMLDNVIPLEIEDGKYVLDISEGINVKWIITYDSIDCNHYDKPGLIGRGDTLIDACAELAIQLKEREII